MQFSIIVVLHFEFRVEYFVLVCSFSDSDRLGSRIRERRVRAHPAESTDIPVASGRLPGSVQRRGVRCLRQPMRGLRRRIAGTRSRLLSSINIFNRFVEFYT